MLLTPFRRTVELSLRMMRVSAPPLTRCECASASETVSVVRWVRSSLGFEKLAMVSA